MGSPCKAPDLFPGSPDAVDVYSHLWGNVLASRAQPERGVCAGNSASLLNVSRASFSGLDLSGVHIPRANLQAAQLYGARLAGANLRGAHLRGAVLDYADVRGADLTGVCAGDQLHTLRGHAAYVTAVAVSADGQTVISGGRDTTVRTWDAATGEPRRALPHAAAVTGVAVAGDGQTLISGCEDGVLRVWHATRGELLRVCLCIGCWCILHSVASLLVQALPLLLLYRTVAPDMPWAAGHPRRGTVGKAGFPPYICTHLVKQHRNNSICALPPKRNQRLCEDHSRCCFRCLSSGYFIVCSSILGSVVSLFVHQFLVRLSHCLFINSCSSC